MGRYIKRDFEGHKLKYPKQYIKVEIESFNPHNNINLTYNGVSKDNNTISAKTVYGSGYTGKIVSGKAQTYQLTSKIKLGQTASYRIELLGLTSTTKGTSIITTQYKEGTTTITKKIGEKSTWNYDQFFNRLDFGVHKLNQGQHTFTIKNNGEFIFLGLKIYEIRHLTGDNQGNGILTINSAEGTINSMSPDTAKIVIQHIDLPYSQGGLLEKRTNLKNEDTGLVFDYRDKVNIYVKNSSYADSSDKLKQVFGGYISQARLSDDKLTINLDCAGRLNDTTKQFNKKEISVGGQVTDHTNLYVADTLHNAISYLSNSIEVPLKVGNLNEIYDLRNKMGFYIDYKIKKYANKVSTSHMNKVINNSGITIQNGSPRKKSQHSILWDSKWENKTFNIKDYPIFHLYYGMGAAPEGTTQSSVVTKSLQQPNKNVTTEKTIKIKAKPSGCTKGIAYKWYTKTWKDKCGYCGRVGTLQINPKGVPEREITCSHCDTDYCGVTGKSKEGGCTMRYKLEPATKAVETTEQKEEVRVGYDTSNPLRCYIELQISTSSGINAPRLYRAINFTAEPTNINPNLLGSITPVLRNNMYNYGELDLMEVLGTFDTDVYIHRIALCYYHDEDSDLYENTEQANYKMIISGFGFREGDARTPELLNASGGRVGDLLKNLVDKLTAKSYMEYSSERSSDTLMFVDDNKLVVGLELKEGHEGNILNVSNLNYTSVSNLKNIITKIYKQGTNYKVVNDNDIFNVMDYGIHEDVEVLNNNIGDYYATYLACTDIDKGIGDYTYTLDLDGFYDLHIGQYVVCSLFNNIYDGVKEIQSISWKYNSDSSPNISMSVGCGQMIKRLKTKNLLSNTRSRLDTARRHFSGELTGLSVELLE